MKLILRNHRYFLVLGSFLLAFLAYRCVDKTTKIDFSAQVKPIINSKCITCHGGVKAKAGFSLLFREEALGKTESGKPAIVPGHPEESEMIRRIKLTDPEDRMPYKHAALSKDDIATLEQWIRQGAQWGDHWAYLPVKTATIPAIENPWIKNNVDRFILSKLNEEKLIPSAPADKSTMLRRVSLDLIGMYPSKEVADEFLNGSSDNAYEVLVDSLLASPHFGEKWASLWMDVSRYADTKGYESDQPRQIWKYRDWLIDAFNKDMPYDQFLRDQIAGDLLPSPSDAQYIATAFSRNSMTNDEGGTNNEEFRTAAVLDRVNTTWESLMGTSFACVQCHSHPYDPFHHDEYYKFMAYFNNSRDEDVLADYPLLRAYGDTAVGEMDKFLEWMKENSDQKNADYYKTFLRTQQPSFYSTKADSLKNAFVINHNYDLAVQNNASVRIGKVNLTDVNHMITAFYTRRVAGIMQIRLDSANGPVIGSTQTLNMQGWQRPMIPLTLKADGMHDVYFTYKTSSKIKPDDFATIYDWFGFLPNWPSSATKNYSENVARFKKLLNAEVVTVPVMVENPDWMLRASHVFERGNRLTLGKEVAAAVPNSLSFAMPANAPKNRMGLAMWLTDKKNPLVSRTMANRLWEQIFGAGIVETLEDMGTQGQAPTHKELLDYLAWKFMNEDQWSMKKLLKELVMSATYRQESKLTEELKAKDISNRYYARGPRVRLSAEQLRDQNLCVSGEMNAKMYGPSVMPWQPDGIWQSPYNGLKWETSDGEAQYRRAVYTYWKRSSPYPSMISFDGVQRNLCSARRIRTNTPLQALTTLNDSVYMDLARHFALRMQKEGGIDAGEQISNGYRWMMFKPIAPAKLDLLKQLYGQALTDFKQSDERTKKLINKKDKESSASLAALIVVANSMMNLDEVITKN